MSRKSLVFITRPLELIGAIEAREKFQIAKVILVICYDKVDLNTHQFLLGKYPEWEEVIWQEMDGNYYGNKWVILVKKLKNYRYEYLLTRSFRTASYFIHNLHYEKLFLLDDGAATINIYNSLVANGNLNNRFHLFKGEENDVLRTKQKKRILKLLLKGISVSKPVEYVNFFTFYEIESNDNCNVVKNEFNWLKKLKGDRLNKLNNVVYFIGNNVIKEGVLSYYDYLETLIKIKEHYKGKEVFYLPHPNEDQGFCDFIENYLGFKIKKNKVNIELSFLIENQIPEIITGTVSTALTTLSFLYKDDFSVEYFNFNLNKISARWKKQIEGMFAYQKARLKENTLEYES